MTEKEVREASLRHCEERSDAAIQRARQRARKMHAELAATADFASLARLPARSWIASLRSQ